VKRIEFSRHALDQLTDRGASRTEVEETIRTGEPIPAKKGRRAYRKNFSYNAVWKGKHYETKQVMPIVVEEANRFVVVTVYIFYFGGKP
jgi:hypothetical protein